MVDSFEWQKYTDSLTRGGVADETGSSRNRRRNAGLAMVFTEYTKRRILCHHADGKSAPTIVKLLAEEASRRAIYVSAAVCWESGKYELSNTSFHRARSR